MRSRGADLLVCETNHDEDWVRSGPYPYALKQRILGDFGATCPMRRGPSWPAGAALAGTRTVLLAHLSSENNTPARAREVVSRRLSALGVRPEEDITLAVAPRSECGALLPAGAGRSSPGLSGKGGIPVLSVYLICVGKLKEKFYQEACAEYIKRLSAYCRLTLVELPEETAAPGPLSGADRRRPGEGGPGHPGQAAPQHQPGVPVRGGQAALQRGAVPLWWGPGSTAPPSTWPLSSAAPTAWRSA